MNKVIIILHKLLNDLSYIFFDQFNLSTKKQIRYLKTPRFLIHQHLNNNFDLNNKK